ncbi:MAG: DUF2283 domain-containing protein [Candidatus Paceibacterota bacterium]
MQVKYDKEIDAKYFKIKAGSVKATQKLNDWLFVDHNENNEVIGLEILDSSQHPVSVTVQKGDFFGCFTEELKPVNQGGEESEYVASFELDKKEKSLA